MTKDEALKLALEFLEQGNFVYPTDLTTAIREALAQPEPVKINHKHEWFRTGAMKVGQMRCISCGIWGQEETPQRTWQGLTDEDCKGMSAGDKVVAMWAERTLKEKNT